jgi:hypothetical protein
MKTLVKTLLLVAITSLCARTGNAQQCGLPGWTLTYYNDFAQTCPSGGPNSYPYQILGMSKSRTYNFECTASSSVQPPPNPGTVYWTYNESTAETGYGQRYCNYSSPYSSYDCPPIMNMVMTQASSPTDYNRFYNQASSFDAVSGSCPQTSFVQDFQQCDGLACQSSPPPSNCPYPQGSPSGNCNSGWTWDTTYCQWVCPNSPVLVDVSGSGFQLTSAEAGVRFDISGTGKPRQIAWTAAGAMNAFLCLPDPDGKCDDGKDLFGNFTPQPPSPTPNGFAALAVYDQRANGGNGDGIIDSGDAIFSALRLWIDVNHDGVSQPEELYTLPSLGVNSISLNYKADNRTDQWGNVFHYRAQVNPGGPASVGRQAYDVFFVGLAPNNTAAAGYKCQVPTKKVGMLAPVSSLR